VQPGDPRADPTVVDLIELAGLWLAAGDWTALKRTLARLDDELATRFVGTDTLRTAFRDVARLLDAPTPDSDALRRAYRRAGLG
jgi:hypothetical protein